MNNLVKKSGIGSERIEIKKDLDPRGPIELTPDIFSTERDERPIPPLRGVIYVHGVPRQGSNLRVQELQQIYGLGQKLAFKACRACGILLSTRAGQLQQDHVRVLEKYLEEETLTGSDRKKLEYENITRHMSRGTYRGIRIRMGLPVRGQRTKTNAYTARKLNVNRGKVKA